MSRVDVINDNTRPLPISEITYNYLLNTVLAAAII